MIQFSFQLEIHQLLLLNHNPIQMIMNIYVKMEQNVQSLEQHVHGLKDHGNHIWEMVISELMLVTIINHFNDQI